MRGIGARVPHDTSVRPSVQQVTQRDLTQRLSIAQRQMDEHPPLAITASQPTTDSAEGATGEFAPLRRPPGDELANRASTHLPNIIRPRWLERSDRSRGN